MALRTTADLHRLICLPSSRAPPSAFWIGAAITFGGVALIAVANATSGRVWNGTLIAISNAAGTWACYTVTIAPLMRYSPFRSARLVLAIGWAPARLVSIPQISAQQFSFGWKVWLGFG